MNRNLTALTTLPNQITTIDSHTAGEATRLVVGGLPPLPGETVNDQRLYMQANHDDVRLLLTQEPRGHRDSFGAVLTEATKPEADFGLIYMDARRYPYMCGHATIGAVTTVLELGWLPVEEEQTEREVVVDTPSGLVPTRAFLRRDDAGQLRVEAVAIHLVPSFVQATGRPVTFPGAGTFQVDLVCVGGYFAMVSADQIDIPLDAAHAPALAKLGMALIAASNEQLTVEHPTRPWVNTVDVTEFYEPHRPGGAPTRSAVVYGESHVDRSPCGTGTSAKMALYHHQGHLSAGEEIISEGLLGTTFRGRIVGETTVGDRQAILPEIRGSAHLTGLHRFFLRNGDPFPEGFLF